MALASLTADLLARKGRATPSSPVQPVTWHTPAQEEPKPDVFDTALKKLMAADTRDAPKKSKKRVHKSFYMDDAHHHQLRMLAARTGKSQQTVIEEALTLFLTEIQKQGQCICGKGT